MRIAARHLRPNDVTTVSGERVIVEEVILSASGATVGVYGVPPSGRVRYQFFIPTQILEVTR